MVALDAKTGAAVPDFGERGYVDLKQSVRGDVDGAFMLDSPPVDLPRHRDHRRQQRRRLAEHRALWRHSRLGRA